MAKDKAADGKSEVVSLRFTFTEPSDAERLMQAFRDGKLAELGIVDIHPTTPEERQATDWRNTIEVRRANSSSPDRASE